MSGSTSQEKWQKKDGNHIPIIPTFDQNQIKSTKQKKYDKTFVCAHNYDYLCIRKRKEPQKEGIGNHKDSQDNKLNKGAVKQRCQATPLKLEKGKSYDVNKFRNSAYACNGSSFSSLWTYFTEEQPPRKLKSTKR